MWNSIVRSWAPFQYQIRRLIVWSREVSKPRDWQFKLLHRFAIWQAHRQQCCRGACRMSERSDNSKYIFQGFETSRYLTIWRLIWYWNGVLAVFYHCILHYFTDTGAIMLHGWAGSWYEKNSTWHISVPMLVCYLQCQKLRTFSLITYTPLFISRVFK